MTGAHQGWRTLKVPIRPGAGKPTHCPWGHDLAVGGVRQSWSQDYRAPEWVCEACYALPGRTGVWAVIDPAVERQVPEDSVDEYGLRLVVVPPPTPAGIGAVRLCLGHKILGEIRMSLCATDRRAVLVHLHIDEECRRRGAGRVLVAAAEARGIDFNWTMVPIERDPVSIAFWARLGTFGSASASPRPCSHQIEAGVIPACD